MKKLNEVRDENVNRLSSLYNDKSKVTYIHYHYLHQILIDTIKKHARGSVLDIGCGNKPYEIIIQQYVNSYIGCDIVQSSLHKVDVLCPAWDLPFSPESFDTVLSTQVLEHVAENQLLINEAFRVLKDNGRFIISAPFFWPLHEEPFDFYRYTKYGMVNMLENAGFSMIEVFPCGGKWAMLGQMLNLISFSYYPKNIIRRSISKVGCWISNRIFVFLDNKNKDYKYTMNYVVVCKK